MQNNFRLVCAAAPRLLLFLLVIGFGMPGSLRADVLTSHNDLLRTGANMNETVLTTTNVNVNTFGKLFTFNANGNFFAQPLYASNLTVKGVKHNVLYLVTGADEVYAVDANNGFILWSDSLGTAPPGRTGIMSTPVIDPGSNTLFVVAYTFERQQFVYRIHALSLTSGTERSDSPVLITASVPGRGYDNNGGVVTFTPGQQLQRVALTLTGGVLYIGFGANADINPYHGWVMAYDTSSLTQIGVYNTTPNSGMGGIWMSGQGFVADSSNNIYFLTGNANEQLENGANDFGESFLKLGILQNRLYVRDFFRVNDYDYLNAVDGDLGSGGAIGIPGTSYIVGGGKQGLLYVVDTTKMGSFNRNKDQVVQEFQGDYGLWGSPVYWNSTTPALYVWGSGDSVRGFSFVNGLFVSSTASQISGVTCRYGGAGLCISSNASKPGTAIVWGAGPVDNYTTYNPGTLFAFDATNLQTPIWTSDQNSQRDAYGPFQNYDPPIESNGMVYVPNGQNQVCAYGLLPGIPTMPTGLKAVSETTGVELTWTVPASVTSYEVDRSLTSGGTFAKVVSGLAAASYIDSDVASGKTYYYKIIAANVTGVGAPSSAISVTFTK